MNSYLRTVKRLANKLAVLLAMTIMLSNTACAQDETTAQAVDSDRQMPPLEALFAGHYKTLRISTLNGDRMVAAYLAIDSKPDYLREGLIRNKEVQITHLIGLTAAICQQWPGGPKAADFSVRWDLFRIPPEPKHFMGRYNISCAMATKAYEEFGTTVSLPFLVAKTPGYLKLAVALPDLKTAEEFAIWKKMLAAIPVATIGNLQPGDQILH